MKTWIEEHIPLKEELPRKEEQINSVTHLAGLLLTAAGTVPLIIKAHRGGLPWMTFSVMAFCFSMALLYGASTIYHILRPGYSKRIGRIFDHMAIYLLIAGTYTPIAFRIWEPEGPVILAILWSLVVTGFVLKILFWQRLKAMHTAVYLAMGWLIVFFWQPVVQRIPGEFIPWAIAGGLSYTVGIIFYASKRVPYSHGIWHLFVLAGSISFYAGIYLHIV